MTTIIKGHKGSERHQNWQGTVFSSSIFFQTTESQETKQPEGSSCALCFSLATPLIIMAFRLLVTSADSREVAGITIIDFNELLY